MSEAATSPLAPIETPYLRDQAHARLRDAIVSGLLPPSAPVVIDDLAATFGSSTMPVREAVKRLVADGLVEELPRRSHRVAPLTKRSALDVLDVTETLMVRAYEVGVPRLTPAEVAAMETHLDEAAAHAGTGDLTAALAAIHAMHSVVYSATGNPEFVRALNSIVPRFDRVLYLWYTDSILDVGGSYRRELVRLLAAGERARAVEVMRQAWQRFRGVIEARPDEPEP